ncbi:acetyltransferase [Salinisphaera aquimarina]|uniref:Acetyltransferase n=1 Tax=Salinisphaera aquimarina TaxID=2094031 RepID=A0ABV7EJG7_9GAMM
MNADELTIAAGVRDACIEAALAGYEDASTSGLCGEGALEVAISAIRRLDLNETLESLAKADEKTDQLPASQR